MNTQRSLERCLTFINCQLHPAASPVFAARNGQHWRAVTISREAGAGGHAVAERLADYLQAKGPKGAPPWTVFDRNLVEKVLEDHQLPRRIAAFMPEDRMPEIQSILDELLGVHPPATALIQNTAETILHLAELGNVILLGRGANIITQRQNWVFHVRLVGSLEKRVGNVQRDRQLDHAAAARFVHDEDLGRQRYLKKYYGKAIDDPLLYHLVINTDLITCERAARIIGDAVLGA